MGGGATVSWVLTAILYLIAIAIGLLLIAALLAPLESLGWWAGWSRRWPEPVSLPAQPATHVRHGDAAPACYVLFLSGIGITDAAELTLKEQNFLDLLAARLPNAIIAHDIFPYSATNNPLTGQRPLRRLWIWIERAVRQPRTKGLFRLVALRNVLQVAVSADRRYGPVYNFGVARGILLSLLRRGYQPGSQAPIILIGLSGGGQIAVGGGATLHRLLDVPIWVVSIGGVLTSDPSILDIEHVFHLAGGQDRIQNLGLMLYPGCWPIARGSAWNRALAQGKRTVIPVGPMTHMSHGDYFSRSMSLPNGRSHVEHTVAVIAEVIAELIAQVLAAPKPGQLVQTTQGEQYRIDEGAGSDAHRSV
jgi:hypothetical protein